ncbi:putative GPI-anchored protein pfl2 [Pomacea canaliculata]|uniref:putative GPI-anchored protein pfl2 n=1 Tax=Pomacea canaliculata TaxID=400727 RepID=UPI000D737976|nr:putative GPI-anchored protein pfl2 [Pomacea canaliculata]
MRHVTCLCRWFPYWYLCCDRKIVINHFELLPHYNEVFPRLRIADNQVAFHPSSSASSDPPDLPTYRQALGFVSLRNQWQTRNGGKANGRELSGTKTGVTLYLPVSRAKPWSQQQGGLPLSPSIDSHRNLLRPLVADTAASDSGSREMWLYPTPSYTLSDTTSYTSDIVPQWTPSNASTTKLISVAAPTNADIILSDTTPNNILSDTTPSTANDKETLSDTKPSNARGKKTSWSTQTITGSHETLYDRTHSNTLAMGSPSDNTQISTRNIELSTPSKTMLSETTTRSLTLSQTVPLTSVAEEIRPHLAPGNTRNTGLATGTMPSNQDTLSRGSPGNTSNMEILSDVLHLTSGTALCHPRKEGITADVGKTKEASSPGPNTQSSSRVQSLDITEIPLVHESLKMVSNRSKAGTGLLKAATPSTLGQHQLPDSAVFSGFQEKNNILLELKSSFLARNSVTYEDIILQEISTAFIANKFLESVNIQPSPLSISFQTPAPAMKSKTVTFDRLNPLSDLSPTSDLLTSFVINPSFAFATMPTIPATPAFDTGRTKDVYHHHRNLEDMQYNSGGDDSLSYLLGEHSLNVGPLTSSRLEDSLPQPSRRFYHFPHIIFNSRRAERE